MTHRATRAWILLCSLTAASCALTSKSEPFEVRYFTPDAPRPPVPPALTLRDARLQLALGRVRASSYLRDRIAYRASENELGLYQSRRWSELPESYLRRALARRLFQDLGVEPVVIGLAPTLDVELVAFEHVRAPARLARVQVVYALFGRDVPNVERTLTVEEPIASGPDAMLEVARALGIALEGAVARVADAAVEHLRAHAVDPEPARSVQGEPPWTTPPSSND